MAKAPKSTKDMNVPKRPLTAYFIWLQANRGGFTKPGMSAAQVAKVAGAAWKKMSAADKSAWEKKAADDKKRYDQEMDAYNKHH